MSFHYKLIIFIIMSAGITWLSRSSLRSFRFHGFYRFFAFEAIIILILLNLEYWFHEPFGFRQTVSWILLIISLILVVFGYKSLRYMGKPDRKRDDPSLAGIERTTELVTVGAYRYIRHPIYSSGIIGSWGVFFKNPSQEGVFLAAITTFFFTMTAKIEEIENIKFFGASYKSYMKQTKMFIPYLF
ncbi:methyltransferase family protein [candidate division KSB1 bacterium]